MRCATFVLIGVLAVPWTNAARASEAYTFVSEYVRELGAIENIRAGAEQEIKEKSPNILADCIRNSTRFQLELRSEISIIRGITLHAPLDDLIPHLAEFYQQKIALYQQLSDSCSVLMAGPQPNVDYANVASEAPKINAQLEYIDHALFDATPLIFATLIDQKPDAENHLSHLVITRAERDKLVSDLTLEFGQKLNEKNQNFTVSAASVLKAYLTKDYKCADDPW
jgi:hypothetical protein